MAVYKSVKGVGKTPASLKNILEYVGKEKQEERVFKTSGIYVSDDYEKAFKQMMITKRVYEKTDGRQYRHHVQSFSPEEITPEKAHEIAIKFAEKNFKDFDVFISTHIDKGHIHNHFIINTVHRKTGMKFRELNKREIEEKKEKNIPLKEYEFILEDLKKSNDEICQEYGLSVIDRTKKKSINIYDKKEFYALQKRGYKVQLAFAVKDTVMVSKNKEEFISKMAEKGISVDWTEKKKHITFHFSEPGKKSIRLSNLEKTFQEDLFTKDSLKRQIERNQDQVQEQKIKIEIPEKNNLDESYEKILQEQRNRERLREIERKKREKEKTAKKSKSRGFGIGD